jgi:hypothetical protein
MERMPAEIDQDTRKTVTTRIAAHVRRGWPWLPAPQVHFRGRFCYVAVLLPGHAEPTPILRLRYEGSIEHWAIGIYLASKERYSEAELPTLTGSKTGTPEDGVDDTFILYAGPASQRRAIQLSGLC